MFPAYNNFEQVQTALEQEAERSSKIGRSFLFDYERQEFLISDGNIRETTEVEAVQQWLELVIRTTIDKFAVYRGTIFGTTIQNYVGYISLPNGFIESELGRELTEAIWLNPALDGIRDLQVQRSQAGLMISFTAVLKNKTLVEVSVNA